LEAQIDRWRRFLDRRQAVGSDDADELEGHLRDQVAELKASGLNDDEAFLVAVKRMGDLDALTREFAREHSDRLWKQLVLSTDSAGSRRTTASLAGMLAFAVAAAVSFKLPLAFGVDFADDDAEIYARNLGLLVLPFLAGYFAWRRSLRVIQFLELAIPFGLAAIFANAYPLTGGPAALTAIHLPIVLWLIVGVAYLGGDWRSSRRRMDFVRFTGEWFIYYVLIALGGGVLIGFTAATFASVGVEAEELLVSWVLPAGATGAVIVAAWLVEAKQGVIENMAPVLTRVFTPLFAVMLLASVGALVWTGNGLDVDRDVLILFDLLLILVLGLLLYSISARDPASPPNLTDAMQLVLVVSMLALDVVALTAIAGRISEFGFSANKTAALGLNLILAVNLAWSARLYLGFWRTRKPFALIEQWQTSYIPVYGLWAAIVVIAFPPIFGFS
jgi:hypothetical protein